MLWLVIACASPPRDLGVYKSGANAIVRGEYRDPLTLWGPGGTVTRVPTAGPNGTTLLGQAGPLWIVDRELAGQEKGPAVPAALVERAGFRMRDVLGGSPGPEIDPVRGAGVSVRSLVKMRRKLAPPVYLASATLGAFGIPGPNGVSRVESPEDCKAAIAVLDADAGKTLASVLLPAAEATCAVPVLAPPVDLDGEGTPDVLVHGQSGKQGFRAWFSVSNDGKLTAGPSSTWTDIP